MQELIKVEEVQEYQNQVSFVESKANELVIASPEDMNMASDLLNDLKKIEKSVVASKQSITRPLMDALASTRNLFKPLEVGYASAKTTINSKILDYSEGEEERIAKETARVEARVLKKTMRVDTAVKKLEEAGEVKSSFDGASSKTSIRKITKVRIIDESLLPREYLVPDMSAITHALLKDKIEVPGAETYEEKSIVSLTR